MNHDNVTNTPFDPALRLDEDEDVTRFFHASVGGRSLHDEQTVIGMFPDSALQTERMFPLSTKPPPTRTPRAPATAVPSLAQLMSAIRAEDAIALRSTRDRSEAPAAPSSPEVSEWWSEDKANSRASSADVTRFDLPSSRRPSGQSSSDIVGDVQRSKPARLWHALGVMAAIAGGLLWWLSCVVP